MRACIKALSHALSGGAAHGGSTTTTISWNEFSTIMMTFNLLPEDRFQSFHQIGDGGGGGGPILAFLDCIFKSVEREKQDTVVLPTKENDDDDNKEKSDFMNQDDVYNMDDSRKKDDDDDKVDEEKDMYD